MTSPKAWLQREKKGLLHEVRSKAHRRLNTVVLVCFAIMVLYEKVGKTAWSIEVAKSVPMLCKCLAFLAMFATIWFVTWRIERRVFAISLPAIEKAWIVWLVVIAFGFAVVSADVRTLFHVGTFSCLIFCWISDRYYRRKGERLREHETVA
jgi:uncharacterized membrane protein